MILLAIIAAVVVLLIVVFGFIGYKKTKKDYAEFVNTTFSKLPVKMAEILEVKTDEEPVSFYTISFQDKGTVTTEEFNAGGIRILFDIKKNEKPYIKFKHLDEDVYYPKVRTWVLNKGYYNVEVHLKEEE